VVSLSELLIFYYTAIAFFARGNRMNRIVLDSPACLHFGLIDMNGEIERIDGGGEVLLTKANNVGMRVLEES